MRATIIPLGLGSEDHHDAAFSLVFLPGPTFCRGEQVLLNLAPRGPAYARGDLDELIASGHLARPGGASERGCVVVVHQAGHGTQADIDTLLHDLQRAGFRPFVVSEPA